MLACIVDLARPVDHLVLASQVGNVLPDATLGLELHISGRLRPLPLGHSHKRPIVLV